MAPSEANGTPEEYELPAVEAVLAGTLALMTGCAQAHCANQRRQMMGRIVCNLDLLVQHPQLSHSFRCALGKLRCHWERLLEDGAPRTRDDVLRHPSPATLQ